MARALRVDIPGAVHHVTSRGNERRPIFHSDEDRERFLALLGAAAKRFRWRVSAYVLMTNHFHLVVQTTDATLSRGMHWLNTSYAAWFNRRHARAGHLFQGRFHSIVIEKAAYFAEVLRYVVLNPVRAKMVNRPEEHRWSSFRATAGIDAAPDWLAVDEALALFGADPKAASAGYARYVAAKITFDESLWDQVRHGIFLGTEPWLLQARKAVESQPRSNDHPKKQRSVGRPSMTHVVHAVAHLTGTSPAHVRSRSSGRLRELVAWLGWHEGLSTLHSIAAALRLRSESYASRLVRRCEQAFTSDRQLLDTLDAALVMLRP